MIIQYGSTKFLSQEGVKYLFQTEKNQKHKTAYAIMYYTGARVSEMLSLVWSDFDFSNRLVKIVTLKKRKKDKVRYVPLCDELIEELSEWFKKTKFNQLSDLVIPGLDGELSRTAIHKKLKKIHPKMSAHVFRHTYATDRLADGVDLYTIKTLLGHDDIRTTQMYVHVPMEQLKRAAAGSRKSRIVKALEKTFGRKEKIHILPIQHGRNNFLIGREKELVRLAELTTKKVNVLIIAPQGYGKRTLIDNLNPEFCMRLDEVRSVKTTLKNMIAHVVSTEDGNARMELYLMGKDYGRYLDKSSVAALSEMLVGITNKYEYSILISDVTSISKGAVKFIEQLKNHFHMVAAARAVKMDKASAFTNFEVLRLETLGRRETVLMIEKLTEDFRYKIHDFEALKNHIYDQTNGVPLFIEEMIDRYKVEPEVSVEVTTEVRHTTATKPVDMTIFVLILIGAMAVFRYVGGEIGEDKGAYKLFGGLSIIILLFARPLFNAMKRKFI